MFGVGWIHSAACFPSPEAASGYGAQLANPSKVQTDPIPFPQQLLPQASGEVGSQHLGQIQGRGRVGTAGFRAEACWLSAGEGRVGWQGRVCTERVGQFWLVCTSHYGLIPPACHPTHTTPSEL